MTDEKYEMQLARMIYHKVMSVMKFTLDLEEQKYFDKGRHDERYKFFKKQLMQETYTMLREIFEQMKKLELLEKTPEPEDVKDGYKSGPSGGSGYINSSDFQEWLES